MRKEGYTLVEVMTVVVAIGILSAMGVSSLQQAAMNARVKDAALNTTAFLERTANEANRLSAAPREGHICVQYASEENYGAAFKTNTVNTILAMWRLGADGTWGAL